jgi:hypothetical protein
MMRLVMGSAFAGSKGGWICEIDRIFDDQGSSSEHGSHHQPTSIKKMPEYALCGGYI